MLIIPTMTYSAEGPSHGWVQTHRLGAMGMMTKGELVRMQL